MFVKFSMLPYFYPSYRSSFVTICGCRRLAGGLSPLLHTGCPLTFAGVQCIRADFVCPQGSNARYLQTFSLRDDVEALERGHGTLMTPHPAFGHLTSHKNNPPECFCSAESKGRRDAIEHVGHAHLTPT